MSKLYLLKPGFSEPTEIYEVELKLVERLDGATMNDVAERLDEMGVTQIIVDASYPNIIDAIRGKFAIKQIFRRPKKASPEH